MAPDRIFLDQLLDCLRLVITEQRCALKLSQEDLAESTGFSRSYVSDIERRRRHFGIKNLLRLSKALGLRPSEMIRRAEEKLFLNQQPVSSNEDYAEKSIESANLGIIICRADLPDNPIVYANGGFERLTGYSENEVIGRNCRFLQKNDRDQEQIAELRNAIKLSKSIIVQLRNYTKNGALFFNELSISYICAERGQISHVVGTQRLVDKL
ncbi:MAG: PAS domain-containing protein [Candidatus Obscuribacterales bacterium]|nr:PAS domain-containing protein [Candidatus Obscuribacterales bacterium]